MRDIPDKRSKIEFRRLLFQFTGRENFILAMDRWFRELSEFERDEDEKWSDWVWAMVLEKEQQTTNVVKRGKNQLGYRNAALSAELERTYKPRYRPCGIYEFGAILPGKRKIRVVYVGSTCVRDGKCPSLQDRIVNYTKNGNHKKDEINEALRKGYTLVVRFKPARDIREAEQMENELLRMYNYAWNIRDNGVRPILDVAKKWE